MCWPRILAAAVSLVAGLVLPGVAHGASPPNSHDPCAHAGRDSCGTTGVGFYRSANYGPRWFGDYRGAIAGHAHTFCIDLRFWYASPGYRYRRQTAALRNRDGEAVPAEQEQRIAYAIWRYGRSSRPVQQAAVMLYVHTMMGDARAGEADPAAVGSDVLPMYRQIARDSARLHGPYRVSVQLPSHLVVDHPASATIRVLAAGGSPVPNVPLTLAADGAAGAPTRIRANAAGDARVQLTPAAVSGLRLRIRTELATSHLDVFAPTAADAKTNGQRLAVPAAEAVTANVMRAVHASPRLATRASAQRTAPGSSVSDTVSISGIGRSAVTIRVELWGPFATRRAIDCSGTPYWTGTIVAHGNGRVASPDVPLERAGYYAFRETIAAGPAISAFVTPCGDRQETTVVHARPTLTTVASPQLVRPGMRIADHIKVEGLGHTPAAIEVELFGPFASRASIRCTYQHLRWHGRLTVPGDGEARSPTVTVARAGLYAFRERLIGTPLTAGVTTRCADTSETALAAPLVVTGRGDVASSRAGARAGARTPVRLELPSLGVAAPISPVAIDVVHGVLGVPSDIDRIGWWRDGAAPGSARGAVLLAGHRDSAQGGDGAFFALATVQRGAVVDIVTADGRRLVYEVTSVRSYPKAELPLNVYAAAGRPRLVLVTCGGPFNAATGHYPNNVVVTAVLRS